MSSVSGDVLASYAADAAREVDGVAGLVGAALPRHKGVRVVEEGGGVRIELHLMIRWGASIPSVAADVQTRVAAYLTRMADVELRAVDVVVDEIGPVRTVP